MSYGLLKSKELEETLARLRRRIGERFPESGLSRIAHEAAEILGEAHARAAWIAKPNVPLRIAVSAFVVLVILVTIFALWGLNLDMRASRLVDFVQMLEAGTNDLILLAAAFYFLFSVELRYKRRRVMRALHKIRSLMHIIDLVQLTKDPTCAITGAKPTPSSPERSLSGAMLSRYLDYCSELLSLLAKIAVLYGQHFEDQVILQTVDGIEELGNGISTKIWQKIMINSEGLRPIELS